MSLKSFPYDELSSTQDEGFALIERGETPPFFVTADRQTKGRGRMQRTWHSESGRSLTMTLMIQMPAHSMPGLSAVVGLSILEVLENENLKLKWPNDLMLNDQKVGGILIESRSHGNLADIAIGIGLNLFSLEGADYKSLEQNVSALSVAESVLKYAKELEAKGFARSKSKYESKLWRLHEVVDFSVQGQVHKVRIMGIDEMGFLLTESGGKLVINLDGEILFE